MKNILIVVTVLLILSGIAIFQFDLLDGYISNNNNETKTEIDNNLDMVGNDRDEHGCIGSAGYVWSETKKECVRPWEEENNVVCDENGTRYNSAADAEKVGLGEAEFGATYCPEYKMHPSWDLNQDGKNDCYEDNSCEKNLDYMSPRPGQDELKIIEEK